MKDLISLASRSYYATYAKQSSYYNAKMNPPQQNGDLYNYAN